MLCNLTAESVCHNLHWQYLTRAIWALPLLYKISGLAKESCQLILEQTALVDKPLWCSVQNRTGALEELHVHSAFP